ncbi:MAG TPA: multicopper oxidase domain-containing protein [Candidatus Acidoferrales bacterium]|nr:multicopper oxidase domain-containing protein [Candidatus Acidoferrales bacterium]
MVTRRVFVQAVTGACIPPAALAAQESPPAKADYTLHIGPVEIEIAPRRRIKTTGYNDAVPGPVLRMQEGKPVTIDVYNDSHIPELVHWHGLWIPPDVDGSAEEGTPMLPPRTHQRYRFVPRPAGTRWYHSHIYAGRDLHRSTYTGQFGFLLIEGKPDPGRYDQEVLLALHGWDPFLTTMGGEGGEGSLEVGYNAFTVNGHALNGGEPIRVKEGQHVLFRILNADASKFHRLALPGHRFQVIALDGNPAPSPASVPILELGPGERIDAVVEMNQPGVWILGDTDESTRKAGLGIVLEYAGRTGAPQWQAAPDLKWDYTAFGSDGISVPEPDTRVPLVFRAKWAGNRWVDHWTINGKEFPKTDPILVRTNRRYRLIFDNQSDDTHPVHLHRHSFELVKVAGKPTAGVMKDVVAVPPRKQVEVDLLASNPGPSLFHCHMQLHMDFGFMALLQYEDHPHPAATSDRHG